MSKAKRLRELEEENNNLRSENKQLREKLNEYATQSRRTLETFMKGGKK